MILNWKIAYQNGLDEMTNEQLSVFVMSEFGLDEEEIETKENQIEGNPMSMSLTRMITGIRFAVYDIIIVNDKEEKTLNVRIRLYKLFILPLLFPIMTLILSDLILPGVIAYLFSIVLFGTIALIELYSDKSKIERKIKTLANKK